MLKIMLKKELIEENVNLKAQIVNLRAENVNLKAENVNLKAKIVELEAKSVRLHSRPRMAPAIEAARLAKYLAKRAGVNPSSFYIGAWVANGHTMFKIMRSPSALDINGLVIERNEMKAYL
jgi:hypothetical protein